MKANGADETGTKAELRAVLLGRRAAVEQEVIRTASERIAERVTSLAEFNSAGTILAYLALPQEAQTARIIECAWLAGKQVAVPSARLDGEYVPVWIKPGDAVVAARFGVREPVVPVPAKPDRFDLVLVPGVAFTVEGARLGHGKGYYDRLLARLGRRARCKMGLCLDFQIVQVIPVTEMDVRMDAVVTEGRICRSSVGRTESNAGERAAGGPMKRGA